MNSKSIILILTVFMFSATIAFSGVSTHKYIGNPWLDATGGPDAYGYIWIDSDEPGGPTYEWIDITSTGTQITGLGDDNYIGPFDVGFQYDYYWYTVEEVYVGSNGYLKIPPGANISQTFPVTIPLSAAPNDYIAVYIMDLDFEAGGEAWYWSNNVDQFIVSFINVPCWSLLGSHNFQVILDNTEHTIVMNYGAQEGTTSNNDILIGIENNNGQVGLLHSADTYIPHNDYTVVFYRPDTTSYEVHDFEVSNVINETSQGIFLEIDEEYTPTAYIKNSGNQAEADADVTCIIRTASGIEVYNQSSSTGALEPGEEIEMTFGETFTSDRTSMFTIEVEVALPGDLNPANDTKSGEIDFVVIPGELICDDGSSDYQWSWMGGDGGIGQRFVPPVYPAEITLIRFYIVGAVANTNFLARVYDDDGGNGMPGTMLFDTTVPVANAGNDWYAANVTGVVIPDGAIYVSWEMTGESTTQIGLDQNIPISRNTYEYTGVWCPFRNAEIYDAMIRAMVGPGIIPEPVIEVSADTIDFGQVDTSLTVTEDFIIYSTGNSDLIIDNITFSNNPGGLFFTLNDFTPGVVVATGDSLELTIDFHPPIPNVISSNMNITSNAITPTYTVYLTGEGTAMSILPRKQGTPVDFELAQNTPNPFNPVTYIEYALPSPSKVELVVYNVLGKEIARLVEGEVSAGYHRVTFDGSNFGSGIYFYKLTAGGFVDMKKMILMK